MRTATVVLDIATKALDQGFTYRVPSSLPANLVGRAVLVPFGNRKAIGFVVAVHEGMPDMEKDERGAGDADRRCDAVVSSSSGDTLVAGMLGDVPAATTSQGVACKVEQRQLFAFGDDLADGSGDDGPEGGSSSGDGLDDVDNGTDDDAGTGTGTGAGTGVEGHASSGRLDDAHAAAVQGMDARIARLKPIEEVLTDPYFTPVGAQLALFLSKRYLAPLSACVRLFTPPGGVPKIEKIDGQWVPALPLVKPVDDRWACLLPAAEGFEPAKNAVKQRAVLELLAAAPMRVVDLKADVGSSVDGALKSLEAKGVVAIERRRRMRGSDVDEGAFRQRVKTPESLTEHQRCAVEAIEGRAASGGGVVVLDGVTGSGKTEVYLQAIARALERGRDAIVLVPEISLTPQTLARFRSRFGNTVAVLHSRMSAGERFDQWEAVRTGQARVVVGARSALFAPVRNLGVLIVDEEHESSYKQDQAPRYVTRDVAEWLVAQTGAVAVLGSATPSIEALQRASDRPGWTLVRMPERVLGQPLPPIQVVDMAREFGQGHRQMFSRPLRQGLLEALRAGHKVVLLLNQRGFAKFVLCRDCGHVPHCASCSTSMTYHDTEKMLVCHHCGRRMPVPPACPDCGSPYLKKFGAGTQRVEAELHALLGSEGVEAEVIRMDADTTARKGAHQALLERFALADAAVLLGTQMIAKGLDFDEVTLVGVIDVDTMLNLPDFRAGERTFALIEQVAGRTGRGSLEGRVVVQTYQATDRVIRAAARYDRQSFLEPELELRCSLGYPPFATLVNVLVWGSNERAVSGQAKALFDALRVALPPQSFPNVEVYPPVPCVLSRVKGAHRFHVLVKVKRGQEGACGDSVIDEVLERIDSCLTDRRVRHGFDNVSVSADVDPESML